jgi:hypothetical protein
MPQDIRRYQAIHAKRRALRRHGIVLSDGDLVSFVQQIEHGNALFVRKGDSRVAIWRVKYAKATLLVAYDAKRHSIASVLPSQDLTTDNVETQDNDVPLKSPVKL